MDSVEKTKLTGSQALLLVEDNEDDVFLMKRALTAAAITNPLHVVSDGEEAIHYLSGAGQFANREVFPMPALIFLDLKLPLKKGLDVLAWIRAQASLSTVVVIVLTSSSEPSDLRRAYELGANSYLVKPPTGQQLNELARAFKWYWLQHNRFDAVEPG